MSSDELNFQYSPSKWVKRVSPQEVVGLHQAFGRKESEIAREVIEKKELNVTYSTSGKDTQVDLFYPNEFNENSPILIYIHGGYWQALSKDESSYFAKSFINSGIAVAVAGYDLCPHVKLSEIVHQIRELTAFLHGKFPKNPIYISGHSAGGHLASMMLYVDWETQYGFTEPFLKGVCLVSGVFDLVPIRRAESVNTEDCLQLNDKDVNENSPIILGKPKVLCPVLIVAGILDSEEFRRQSIEFSQILRATLEEKRHPGFWEEDGEGDVKVLIIEGKDHFNVMEDFSKPDYLPAMLLKKLCLRKL